MITKFDRTPSDPDDPQSLSSNEVRTIYEDGSGVLWIGTYGGGLNRFDRERERFIRYQPNVNDPHSISHQAIFAINQDQEGVLWIGTEGGGLNKLNLAGLKFASFNADPNNPNSLGNSDVRGIHEDRSGRLWVGTNDGLNRFDPKNGQWHHYYHDPNDPKSLSSDIVGDVYEDQSGQIWVGTFDAGINLKEPSDEGFIHYQADPEDPASLSSNFVTTIYQDRAGVLWFGTDTGLNRYDEESDSFTSYQANPADPNSLPHNTIFSLYEDRQGTFWVGSFGGGMSKFDRENERFTNFQTDAQSEGSLSNNLVTSFLEDESGTLWIGTVGGLNKFDRQAERFTHFRENDGLSNDTVVGILEDEQGNLWLSTNNGLSKFDPRSEVFTNFDVGDGLQSQEFSGLAYHQNSSGLMFFGGINGFNAFSPAAIRGNNAVPPPVVLTSLTQGGDAMETAVPVENVNDITLTWPANFFEFEFAALSYVNPEENQYAYILEGFDEDWVEVGNRSYGRYTNLPGGTYTLRLIGSNNDGAWNEQGASVEITVVPPFWQTWWFFAGMFILFIGIVFAGVGLRVRNVETRRRELEVLVTERTATLSQTNLLLEQEMTERRYAEAELAQRAAADAVIEERNRLARELHDSVTQSLHGATLIAEAGQRLAAAGDLERVKGYLVRLGEISQQALKEMRLLVYELRPLALEEVTLTEALRQRLDAVERRAGVDVQLLADDSIELPDAIEEALYRIAQEALNNALQHAAPTSIVVRIDVTGEPPDQQIRLEVADDGAGFEPNKLDDQGGIGLASMRERAENLGGDLAVQSSSGGGTRVAVTAGFRSITSEAKRGTE